MPPRIRQTHRRKRGPIGTTGYEPDSGSLPSVEECLGNFVQQCQKHFDLAMTCLWSLRPIERTLVFVAGHGGIPLDAFPAVQHFEHSDSTTCQAAMTRQIARCGNMSPETAAIRKTSEIGPLDLTSVTSVPVLNTSSYNQVLFVVDLVPRPGTRIPPDAVLRRVAQEFATDVEECLREVCSRAATRLQVEISKSVSADENLGMILAKTVGEKVKCDVVSVFMQAVQGAELARSAIWCLPELRAISAASGLPPSYAENECGSTGARISELAASAFTRNREQFSRKETSDGSSEIEPSRFHDSNEVAVPVRDAQGAPKGAIVCVRSGKNLFTYEDTAVLEAVLDAFAPYAQVQLMERNRLNEFNKLAHELRVPVAAFRAALERVTKECKLRAYRFSQPFLEDLERYADVMQSQVRELDLLRLGARHVPLHSRKTKFSSDIIAPACRFVEPLLDQRGFRRDAIDREGIGTFPKLFVDPVLLTQVVFNLLENAIKYAKDNPEKFRIDIVAHANSAASRYEISFSDRGIGVPDGWEERIFEQGVRGTNINEYEVMGDGYGLYLAIPVKVLSFCGFEVYGNLVARVRGVSAGGR